MKILQRPKTDSGQATNGSGLYSNRNGTLSLKTFQEREAEYAKARLRIMGSAVPNYDEKNQLRSSLLSPMNTATPVVKEESVSRPPQGPPLVGGRGFGIRR